MIRPFVAADVSAVARLRGEVFDHSRWSTQEDLEEYMKMVFLENPWVDPELPSYVLEQGSKVVGFVGVVPRPVRYKGRDLRGAVTTQFMVKPEHRGLAGIQLVQKVFQGPQDCLFADISNEASRIIWQGLGGSTAPIYGFNWSIVLRPARSLAGRLGQHPVARGCRFLSRPALDLIDSLIRRRSRPEGIPRPHGCLEPLDPVTVVDHLGEMAGRPVFHAVYTGDTLQWVLDRIRHKHNGGVSMRLARSREGQVMGWFIRTRNPGGTSQLLHLVAHAPHYGSLLGHLIAEALTDGSVTVQGRSDPNHNRHLRSAGAAFAYANPGLLVQARDHDLSRAVLEGRAILSGLEGEWWMDF